MRAIDKYLPTALQVIEDKKSGFWDKKKNTQIPKVYKGYIASFGTIIKQSGLLPAVVLFCKESEGESASKKPILEAIFTLMKKHSGLVGSEKDILDFARSNQNSAKARREMIHAAIALKLALRTFNIEK